MDQLTVLSHPHALATKRKFLGPDGQILTEPYGKGKFFQCHSAPVTNFDDLASWLESLTAETRAFVIRGEPLPGRDLTHIRRTKRTQAGDPAGFREVPRRWLMVDADHALAPEETADLDLARPEDCLEGVRRLLAKLPPELQRASCFWQLSSNAGFADAFKAHLWFWLDRPMGETELSLWAENANDAAGRQLIDPHVFATVQPHYTAAPVLDIGVADPVGQRFGIIAGTPELSLPRMAERTGTWLAKLAPLRNPANSLVHDHVRDACASYFRAHGPDADDTELRAALRAAVDRSCALRGVTDSKYDDGRLGAYVTSGREWALRHGAIAENLVRNGDGTLKATQENARAILVCTPEWDGVLGYDARRDQPVALAEPPFEEGYRGPSVAYPREWTDADDMRTVSWLQRSKHALVVSKFVVRDAITLIARERTFDEVIEYLRGLRWDGVPRVDGWLIRYCGAADSRYTRKVGAMALIQAVARGLEPGAKADGVLVLEGPQGRRKSSLLRELFGGIRLFREGIGDIHNVETWKALQTAWCTELRELAGITNREVEAVKTFLDKQNDHYRGSYDMRPTDHPRRTVFVATTNSHSYLRDDTGARRWWPVEIDDCDVDGIEADRDQLWAEAAHRYHAGESWWVEADDPDFVGEQDERFDRDEREDQLRDALDQGVARPRFATDPPHPVPPIPPMTQHVTVSQILYHHWNLPVREQTKGQQMAVASMLRRLRWNKNKVNRKIVWKR